MKTRSRLNLKLDALAAQDLCHSSGSDFPGQESQLPGDLHLTVVYIGTPQTPTASSYARPAGRKRYLPSRDNSGQPINVKLAPLWEGDFMHQLAASSDAGSTALGFVIWAVIVIVYWVPTIIALFRWKDIPNGGGVIVLNFFGFLFVTWIIALVMAVRSKPQPLQVQYAPPPGYQQYGAGPYGPPPPSE